MSQPTKTPHNIIKISRRKFMNQSAGALASIVAAQFAITREAAAAQLASQKNFILIITDQERAPMWFPPKWSEGDSTANPPFEANLPNTERLKANGLTFNNAYTAACMCTPARNCILTGQYVAQHRSDWTLTEETDQALEEHQLDPSLPNMATCLKDAGYDVIYKGKWHVTKKVTNADGTTFTEDDPARYGFDDWNGPDAGGDANIENFGGADALNTTKFDQQYVDETVDFLTDRFANPTGKPFFLILSLVNPHDVLSYPSKYVDSNGVAIAGGYKDGYGTEDPWIAPTEPPIELPPTVDEDLSLKPTPHNSILRLQLEIGGALALGLLPTEQEKLNYINFYGQLIKAVDKQIGQVLDVLDPDGDGTGQAFKDTIIIRTSDHGEMGLAHGGLRQKAFVAYEETVRVPMIWSNPELFPTAQSTDALVSHVDLLPTLCALTGDRSNSFAGVDYSQIILEPEANTGATAVRDYVVFTFDDIYSAGDRADLGEDGAISPPNRIQMIRTPDFKLVRYWDGAGVEADQGEFYDLRPTGGDYYLNTGLAGATVYNEGGPLETNNLKDTPSIELTTEQASARDELELLMSNIESSELAPRTTDNSIPPGPPEPEVCVKRWTDDEGTEQAEVQITFISREGRTYQLQRRTDLATGDWEDIPNIICADEQDPPITDPSLPVAGNNGLIAFCTEVTTDRAFYRLIETTL